MSDGGEQDKVAPLTFSSAVTGYHADVNNAIKEVTDKLG